MDVPRVRLNVALASALTVLALAVYAPVFKFEFLNYDDQAYVVDNAHIGKGLTAVNVGWAMTAFENANWHPLTLIAHMMDVQVFGFAPSGHHGVNLGLHVVNVLLLFWFLSATTLRPWPSCWVAALFAVHPLNVETVAWISERKSVLSTAFWLTALIAFSAYRRKPSAGRYAALLLLAGCALASKPMAVTLPFTLILVDVWPIPASPGRISPVTVRTLRELSPIVAMAGACGVLTLLAQHAAHAIRPATSYPFLLRAGNAVVAYVWYLKKAIWPAGLAVFYPHPMGSLAIGTVVAEAVVLVAVAVIIVKKGGSAPSLAVGWWWYAITLLPVAGLIQVGNQAYADRYAYVPLVGIFVVIVWSAVRFVDSRSGIWSRSASVVAAVWIAALSVSTRAQLSYWHDSAALFRHAVEVIPDNGFAYNNLGMALVERNDMAGALDQFQNAVSASPWDTDARSNLGNALRALGRPVEAVEAYERALSLAPGDASIHYNLATALLDVRKMDAAVFHLREAVRLDPAYMKARNLLERIEAQPVR